MVIDTHTHCWGPPSEEHPWTNQLIIGGEDEYARGDFLDDFSTDLVYTAEKLIDDMDKAVVDESVIIGYPIGPWDDNWYTLKAAEEYDRLYGVVNVDVFDENAIDTLNKCMSVEDILGLRLGAGCPYDQMWENFDPEVNWLLDAIEERDFWEEAEQLNAPVHIWTLPQQIDQVVKFVQTYPDLKYVLDHFLYIRGDVRPGEGPFNQLSKLADYDNVMMKISGVVTLSDIGYPYPDKHDHVVWLLEHFGRERLCWGSDWPNDSHDAEYYEILSWLHHIDELSEKDLDWIFERSFYNHMGM